MPTFPPNATFTPRLQLPRPGLDDVADGPDAFNDLTDVLDPIATVYLQGTVAARPAAGIPGRFYWATDTKAIYYDDGVAWQSGAGSVSVGSGLPILDVGQAGQIRAGRALTVADFTALGLAQPIGLWNLSDLTNLGSDGRALANKGAVPFGVGINGLASTAAVFAGSASQALYIADSGAADPFRIKTGSWGCWFRTAKRAVAQFLVAKWGTTGQPAWYMSISTPNMVASVGMSPDGAATATATGVSDVVDDRWHFVVGTHDGTTLRLYVDGALEAVLAQAGPINPGSSPLNIGAAAADAATAAASPHYGRVDEAFVTADVLSEDQIRSLYAAKLAHGLGVAPTRASVNVHRKRRGAVFVGGDFTTQPLRLHNFTAGALTDQGSGNVALINNGAAISVSGADGTPGGAYSFAGAQSLSATDAGLPAGTAARSYGCWFKTSVVGVGGIVVWGTGAAAMTRINIAGGGQIAANNGSDAIVGPFAADGQWHLAVVTEDNVAGDGVRRKLYLDGRLVGASTVLNAITSAGAGGFKIGQTDGGVNPISGQIDAAFVCGYALTQADVLALWAKGSQALAASPKNAGDHVEALTATDVLFIGDTLESQHTVDLGVAA